MTTAPTADRPELTGVQELVHIGPQQRVGHRVRRGQIAGAQDDPGELALELQHGPEDPQVGTGVGGRGMREAHGQRPPPRTVQLAVDMVQRVQYALSRNVY